MSRVNTQGIIQQLEHYTNSDLNDQLVLRLRGNKIVEGDYKGSRWGQFKHWCISPFLSQAAKDRREQYLQKVTSEESVALAKALCRDISRRTPIPFDADVSLTVKDVKQAITASQTDRQKFSQIVRDLINCATVPDPLGKGPMQALSERIDQAINDRTIRRTEQIKQLCNEVIDDINKRNINRSEKKQLVKSINELLFQKQELLLLLQEAEVIALDKGLTNTPLLVNTSAPDTEQDKKVLISRAIKTLKTRYPAVFPPHNQSREKQLGTYLEKSLTDRSVTVLDNSVIRPLVNNAVDLAQSRDRRDSGISVSNNLPLSEDNFLQGVPPAPEFLVPDDDTPLPPPPLEETIEGSGNTGITPPPPPPPPLPTTTEGRNNSDSAASDQIQNKVKSKPFKGIKKHSSDLLQAIRKGLRLKKTPKADQQKKKPELDGTAAILNRRIAIAPDEDDFDTNDGYDSDRDESEWD